MDNTQYEVNMRLVESDCLDLVDKRHKIRVGFQLFSNLFRQLDKMVCYT